MSSYVVTYGATNEVEITSRYRPYSTPYKEYLIFSRRLDDYLVCEMYIIGDYEIWDLKHIQLDPRQEHDLRFSYFHRKIAASMALM